LDILLGKWDVLQEYMGRIQEVQACLVDRQDGIMEFMKRMVVNSGKKMMIFLRDAWG